MGFRRGLGLAAVVLVASSVLASDDVYVRNASTIEQVVSRLETLCTNRGCKNVLVVFDGVTFAPPTGWSPFRKEYDYARDLAAWAQALQQWSSQKKRTIRVTTTLSSKSLATRGKWIESLRKDLPDADRRRRSYPPLKPAKKWLAKLIRKVRPKTALVLVAGELMPEETNSGQLSSRGKQQGGKAPSKTLLPVGSYWDPEEVARLLNKRKIVFYVVAPEARFGNFLPLDEMPQLPWVTRPVVGRAGTKRFRAEFAGRVSIFYNTDCPSGYGVWGYARTAAATGGHYLLYPFPESDWLDTCRFDPKLRSKLAPELTSLTEYLQSREGDPALEAIRKATTLIRDKTPWRAGMWSNVPDLPWMAFETISPIKVSKHYDPSIRPQESRPRSVRLTNLKDARAEVERYVGAIPAYDEALAILNEAKKSTDAKGNHPRSVAHLRLASFWFAMAAFHLQATGQALTEAIENPPSDRSKPKELRVSFRSRPVLRLSDCLDPLPGLPKDDSTPQKRKTAYRALRPTEMVLQRVEPRLRRRAEQLIEAARDVRAHEGPTPWGWMVYYSEAVEFEAWWWRKGKTASVKRRRKPTSGTAGPLTAPPVVKPGSGSSAPSSGGG